MSFMAKTNAKRGELYLYDPIGADFFGDGVTAKGVQKALDGMKGVQGLDIFVNSPGGDVFEGVTIFNQLQRFEVPKKVHVDGLAASIASVIAMVGDEIVIADNAMMMIHEPWGVCIGNAEDLRKRADLMDTVKGTLVGTYAERTSQKPEAIEQWMAAETWMTAAECVERGFADRSVKEGTVASSESVTAAAATAAILAKFKNAPQSLRPSASSVGRANQARMSMRVARLRAEGVVARPA